MVLETFALFEHLAPENAAILNQRPAIALVSVQVFFWGAGAIVEMRLSRARRAGAMVPRSLAIILLTSAAIFGLGLAGSLTFPWLLALLAGQQALYCLAMYDVLWRRKVLPRKSFIATLCAGLAVTMTAAMALLAGQH